jgi:hypothetical protein
VQYKTFAVGTEGFLPPGFPDLVATAKGDDISSRRGVLLVRVMGLLGSACRHKRVHSLHHGVHACFVHSSICAICFACGSCSIANSITCILPSSFAAAVSCASSTASMNHDCFAVVAKYCFCSSHFSVNFDWSAAHVCAIAPLFSQTTIWSSMNISN